MAIRVFTPTKDNCSRVQGDGDKQGNGADQHLLVGRIGGDGNRYRSFLQHGHNFSGMAKVIRATLVLHTSNVHGAQGTTSLLRTRRNTDSWSEGNRPESSFGKDEYIDPPYDSRYHVTGDPPGGVDVEFRLDISTHFNYWTPKNVTAPNGKAGLGITNYGLRMVAPDDTDSKDASVFWSRHATLASNRPYIEVEYEPVATAPTAVLVSPIGSIPSDGTNFEVNFVSNTLPTDVPSRIVIEVYAGSTKQWTKDRSASGSEQVAKHLSEPLPGPPESLKSGVTYGWRAQVYDDRGKASAWTAQQTFSISNDLPVASALVPSGSLTTLDGARFVAHFSDVNAGDYLSRLQIQLQAAAAADWTDPSTRLWDTDEVASTAAEQAAAAISREYAGQALDVGDYTWRVRLQDSRGGWSAWVEADFTLATDYTPDLQSSQWTTGYNRERPPVRILILDLNRNPTTGVVINRGPGKTLGVIEDASNIGASEYLNAPGEVFFTLPALHPQASVVEPYITHYRIEQYRRDRWVPIYRGLITDFEATEDETVFYGMDYVALLNISVDERYDPENADLAEPTGSKYNDKTIKYIIDTQLTLAKAEPNGLVNFIDKGSGHVPSAFSEKVIIWSTFKQRLDFIVGLIQSHNAGTGKQPRLFARLDTDGVYRWYLPEDYGQRRDNIRLEYGGLVQGFTVVALGEFGTTFLGMGRIFNESKLQFSKQSAPGMVEADWGHVAKVTSFADLYDRNDLNRRTREFASKTGTVGKRVALGLRVDGLSPYDGYDVGDRVPVLIQYGNVDTTRYGSTYWTIVGTEFEVAPDGHTTLTLVLLPETNRGDLVIPPDLIPSIPYVPPSAGGGNPEWEVGYEPPSGTTGDFYLDLTTGIVWEQTGSGWVISTSPPSLAAPLALALTTTSDSNDQGGTVAKLTAEITPDPSWGTEYRGTYVEVTAETDGANPPNPVWDNAEMLFIPTGEVAGSVEGVVTGVPYYAQAWATDFVGGVSPVLAHETQVSASDTEAPGQPQGFEVVAQVEGFFAAWDRTAANDLAYVELRYAVDDGSGTGVGSSPAWRVARARTNFAYVGALIPDQKYWAQVRAVDTSDNVEDASVTPPVVYKASNFEDIGYTTLVEVTPVKVGSDLIEDGSISTDHIVLEGLSAEVIKTGTLQISLTDDDMLDGIRVSSEGITVGFWNETGLYVYDAENPSNYVRLFEAGVTVFREGVEVAAITPDGINATAITLGALPGGNNIIPNSSFELANFSAVATFNHVWTASADWTATRVGSDVNVTTGASALSQTGATY